MPVPGWAARPAGLFTTRMCSSSWRTRNVTATGLAGFPAGSLGPSRRSSSPPPSTASPPPTTSPAPVPPPLPRPQELVDMGERHVLQGAAQELVEPLAGCVGADLPFEHDRRSTALPGASASFR